MGLEYITQPQVFVQGLTALGQGIQGLTENYPLLTTYNYWTSTAVINTTTFPIPGVWSIYDGLNNSASFLVTVGGVTQSPSSYTVDPINRLLTFDTVISAGIKIAATQLATAAPSSQSFDFVKSVSAEFITLSAQNIISTNTNLSGSSLNVSNISATNFTATNLLVTNLTALSSVLNVTDITQYELSGFNVFGNANIAGNVNVVETVSAANLVAVSNITTSCLSTISLSSLNITITNNGSIVGQTSATTFNIGALSARELNLIHAPANDGVDPILNFGETDTAGFSGIRVRYEEPTNRLFLSSRTGTTVLTSVIIDVATGQIGISGLPAAGQALTVSGNVSASGTINAGRNLTVTGNLSASGNITGLNTDSYLYLNQNRSVLIGSVTAAYFDPAISLRLLPSRTYFVQYDLYFAKDGQTGGLNYILSAGTGLFENVSANYTHKTNLAASTAPTQLAGVISGMVMGPGAAFVLPTIANISASLNHYTNIKSTIETGSAGNTLILAVSSGGNITPLRGSQYIVTLLPQ